MLIYVNIDRNTAIRDGVEPSTRVQFDADLKLLTPEQRDELARLEPHGNYPNLTLSTNDNPTYSTYVGYVTKFSTPTQELVAAALDERRTRRLAHEAAYRADKARSKARDIDDLRTRLVAYIDLPLDERIGRPVPAPWGTKDGMDVLNDLFAQAEIARQEARAEEDRRKEETRACVEQQNAKAAADREAHTAARNAWLDATLTDTQKRRHAAGLMPDGEIDDLVRDDAFKPLADRPRYERLTAKDWPGEDATLEYGVMPAPGCTDEQFTAMEGIVKAMPDATVELRLHSMWDGNVERSDVVERLSYRVTVTKFGRKYSREYAA